MERSISHRAVCEEQKTQAKLSSKKSNAMIIRRRSSLAELDSGEMFSGTIVRLDPHRIPDFADEIKGF